MPAVLRPPPARGWLWFGILGAPLAWGTQEWLGWYLASAPCEPRAPSHAIVGQADWLQAGVHGLALLTAVAALGVGLHGWRRAAAAGTDYGVRANALLVDRFLATAATVISAVGIAALVWASLGTFLLPACETMR